MSAAGALLPVALRVLGLVVVLLARVLILHRAATAAGLADGFLALGRVVAVHLAFAHRRRAPRVGRTGRPRRQENGRTRERVPAVWTDPFPNACPMRTP